MIRNYSIFIKPISIFAHLFILNLVFTLGQFEYYTEFYHILFFNLSWLVLSYFTGLYNYHRTVTVTQVTRHLLTQFSVFTLTFFAYFTLTHQFVNIKKVTLLLIISFLGITLFRALYFYALRRYRIGGGNFRKIIFVGSGNGLRPLVDFMMNRADFGFKIMGYFSDDSKHVLKYTLTERVLMKDESNGFLPYLGTLDSHEQYAIENNIDEIYCSLSELKSDAIKSIIDFGDANTKIVKLVPDNKDFITKNLKLEYYGFVPVYSIRNFPLDKVLNRFLKRFFDIVFSIIIIVFLLSWLTPLLYFLIKRESKGPLFFTQVREGIKGNSFVCYKYRSMGVNDRSDKDQTVKGDMRITKIGKFIRKKSIDELPQFFNVLKGEMSVVGPRPHMLSQSDKFKKIVDKYMVRHFVKPGITGLAQVRGFRGEIETDQDIINRVKLDIFYVENWSFVMDMNIILKTFLNILIGEKKAY